MAELLVVADDFTGALDTGVRFASLGLRTRVHASETAFMRAVAEDRVGSAASADVIVVNTESRHAPAPEALAIVERTACTAIRRLGIARVFKKTDSGLRGNIGAELEGALRAAEEAGIASRLAFAPAFPAMGRTTEDGIQLIDGVPVAQSVFGRDPFSPVRHSRVADIIAEQSGPGIVERIAVHDARTDADLQAIAERLFAGGSASLVAGCAGFADAYVHALCAECSFELDGSGSTAALSGNGMLVLCGSLNPVSMAQLDSAEAHGFSRVDLSGSALAEPGFWDGAAGSAAFAGIASILQQGSNVIVDTLGDSRTGTLGASADAPAREAGLAIARSMGELYGRLIASGALGAGMDTFIIGGDTLIACMERVGVDEIEPACELAPGVVFSHVGIAGERRTLVSKSGGFGGPDLLVELAQPIRDPSSGCRGEE